MQLHQHLSRHCCIRAPTPCTFFLPFLYIAIIMRFSSVAVHYRRICRIPPLVNSLALQNRRFCQRFSAFFLQVTPQDLQNGVFMRFKQGSRCIYAFLCIIYPICRIDKCKIPFFSSLFSVPFLPLFINTYVSAHEKDC